MGLQGRVEDAFSEQGALSRMTHEFRLRPGQLDMAQAITRTLEEGGVLVVEAGTGIGKTFAYLVPALLSGNRVLLSTATKALQDQLFGRDLPGLVQALALPLKTAMLKGRASYLCQHRLQLARLEADPADSEQLAILARIELWAQASVSGDLAELSDLHERSPWVALVTSTRDNCLGSKCPSWRVCHVNQARREALSADVVVVNHHLFFADLAVRESGLAELLPSVQTVIFDEAHQLNETGVQFLGQQVSTAQISDFAGDLLHAGLLHARGWCDWPQLASRLQQAALDWRLLLGRQTTVVKLPWFDPHTDDARAPAWRAAIDLVHQALDQARLALESVAETGPELSRLSERVLSLIERIEGFSLPCPVGSTRWLELGGHLKLMETPLDIAQTVQTRLLEVQAESLAPRSWIFTSASLGHDAALTWFTEPCGLTAARVLRIDSPFDYARQAALYVPRDLPKPDHPEHSAQVANFVAKVALALGGRTLVLTTSLRALQLISEALIKAFSGSGSIDILVQGRGSKRDLMSRFRRGGSATTAGCVLVASASFWEGVDIPGAALQMVVIDKLPFPFPQDPLVQARAQRLEAAGRPVFKDYYLPEAAIALKQGAGRLIRHESDRGVLVVCDTRLTGMGYGRRLLAALPPMRRLADETELAAFLEELTKVSTKDSGRP